MFSLSFSVIIIIVISIFILSANSDIQTELDDNKKHSQPVFSVVNVSI